MQFEMLYLNIILALIIVVVITLLFLLLLIKTNRSLTLGGSDGIIPTFPDPLDTRGH